MKKIILICGCLALVFNVLLGMLLSHYDYFNMGVNCGVIVLNTVLLLSLYWLNMRDAFRLSFSFLFTFLAVVEIILGCLMPQKLQDNGYLIAMIVLLVIEISIMVITNIVSTKLKSSTNDLS